MGGRLGIFVGGRIGSGSSLSLDSLSSGWSPMICEGIRASAGRWRTILLFSSSFRCEAVLSILAMTSECTGFKVPQALCLWGPTLSVHLLRASRINKLFIRL
ncbi:hypothetical protein EGW08_013492 [Elysia chlorotica]|uniref:Uncharacterized protein n=1 Tax=Elysia chlorotica TaxID=188477 RepID=A0A433TAY3_ELYCH|nr:hypothetical protein EGW08_013492 [Elysia chlorotica]